jgi:hypothetical protein
MKRTADRDDRDAERMATLVEYAGQQSREARDAVSQQGAVLARMADTLDKLVKGSG